MSHDLWLERLRRDPVLAVIRTRDPQQAWQQAEWVARRGGMGIELTTTIPDYGSLIRRLRQDYPQVQIGCGTVTTLEQAEVARRAGSQFLVSPILHPGVLARGQEAGIPVITGGLTPQEIWQGWVAGAAAVKVFPVVSVGGASYIRHLQGPFPEIPLIPTGGITPATIGDYLAAGAVGVGMGSGLFSADWQEDGSPKEGVD